MLSSSVMRPKPAPRSGQSRKGHLARASLVVVSTLGLTSACSLDWDHLDPSQGSATSAGGSVATGGVIGEGGANDTGGTSSTGGSSDSGGSSSTGGSSTGGTVEPLCAGSILTNTGFELLKKEAPASWTLTEVDGTGAIWVTQDEFKVAGVHAVSLDTREITSTGTYQAVVSSTAVAINGQAKITATIAVRADQLAHDAVNVLARFATPGKTVDVPLQAVEASPAFVTVGLANVAIPDGATTVSLVVTSPDGALVYLDSACLAFEQ